MQRHRRCILEQDDETVTLDVEGTPRAVALTDITKAHVQIEFNRPATGGREES